ncbi:DNA-binding transcriptional regulator [Maridesulfovibrio ferrireducens]|uniref:helix-turn-helix domain-containing protein n=1 Tax=Maridesulfovibrio ferrireducens TaxID=246191 RepID=UPI001A1A6B29|nr:helix-turn-helix domain-containing protein [Maridesulfovibrio ferrireducens]MBI9110335.1 helix-turn-helix domain-containing protein [Maridesulfovibrio ferrireducens]
MGSAGNRILKSLEQAVSIAKGEMEECEYRVNIPAEVDVRNIRKKLNMTQIVFAKAFGLSLSSVRHWEQKRRVPEGPTRAYLMIIAKEPDMVRRVLSDSGKELR